MDVIFAVHVQEKLIVIPADADRFPVSLFLGVLEALT